MCHNIYRDTIKISIGLKGVAGLCEIGEVPAEEMLMAGIQFFQNVCGSEYSELFAEISGGMIYSQRQPNIEVGMINNP
jgi:hypothetical protein